ncbi:AbrB/MazE/SpoVT family DNA-binding domain-containing protein [Actinoplanes sp. NPDC023936]|uniref:AbrB/MazE/SpoVT family DNA-binding domain-containing protein n=1 Tax=Actinoplanes sp. NPDC023936 TaxID=3154910 RepID=UPI0033C055E7
MCAIEGKGRISDAKVMAALGWQPGLRVTFAVAHGVIVIGADDAGGQAICGRGCLRLPAGLRRAAGIGVAERVLLAGLPEPGRLIVHPLGQLDRWSAAVHVAVLGGVR